MQPLDIVLMKKAPIYVTEKGENFCYILNPFVGHSLNYEISDFGRNYPVKLNICINTSQFAKSVSILKRYVDKILNVTQLFLC